jgi:iron-binding CDGSH zinc finger protein
VSQPARTQPDATRWRARAGDGTEIAGELCPDGPLLVRHAATVEDRDGEIHEVTRPVVALCICDLSQRAPWCDSTHKSIPKRG